eukprot:TRINITY_DN11475_c0_g2_i3.p1 TRINITY_DN11475_c0_g2~~TRINITY_DN11475_c0_g2_i3.p1  ORF type:complete len:139 (-),score=6.47 TRINITY_DN11475_c0_g2_i3:416-832(-)
MQFPTVARSAIEVIERGDPLKALCSGTVVSVRLFTRPESSWNPEEKGHFYTLFSLLDQPIVSCVGFLHDPTFYDALAPHGNAQSLPTERSVKALKAMPSGEGQRLSSLGHLRSVYLRMPSACLHGHAPPCPTALRSQV